jgi:hypothetical protein
MGLIRPNPFQSVRVGSGQQFDPLALGNWVLYLDSRRKISGADQSIVNPWPDLSPNAYNASHDTSNGNNGEMRLNLGVNRSPNGQQTVGFTGVDFPHAPVGLNAQPNPWPSVTGGYTFYFGGNLQVSASSYGVGMLWNEGTANLRWVYENPTFWEYRDQAGVNRPTNIVFAPGWQSARLVIHAAGTVDMYVNGVQATWGGWNKLWNIPAGALAGYTLANLATNYMTGLTGYLGWFFWHGVEDSLAAQKLIENFMRGQFGLAPA